MITEGRLYVHSGHRIPSGQNPKVKKQASAGSARMSTALCWLIACVRDLFAESFACRNMRSISTGPSPDLATVMARPDRIARAAASASMASVLPRRRRSLRSGWLTATTSTPA